MSDEAKRLAHAQRWAGWFSTVKHEDLVMTFAEDGSVATSVAESFAYLLARVETLERALTQAELILSDGDYGEDREWREARDAARAALKGWA